MYPSRFRYEAPRSLDEAIGLLHDGRRRGQGAGRRAEPGPAAEAALRRRRSCWSTSTTCPAWTTTGSTRTARSASARCAGTPTWSARRCSPSRQPTMAAAAPLIADPIVRNRGTLVGSLCHADPQGDWASVVTALGGHVVAQGPGGRRTIPIGRVRHRPVPERARPTTRSPSRRSSRRRKGTPAGGYLKLERRVGDFATAGVAVALELVRRGRHRGPASR